MYVYIYIYISMSSSISSISSMLSISSISTPTQKQPESHHHKHNQNHNHNHNRSLNHHEDDDKIAHSTAVKNCGRWLIPRSPAVATPLMLGWDSAHADKCCCNIRAVLRWQHFKSVSKEPKEYKGLSMCIIHYTSSSRASGGGSFRGKNPISQIKNLPIECAQGHQVSVVLVMLLICVSVMSVLVGHLDLLKDGNSQVDADEAGETDLTLACLWKAPSVVQVIVMVESWKSLISDENQNSSVPYFFVDQYRWINLQVYGGQMKPFAFGSWVMLGPFTLNRITEAIRWELKIRISGTLWRSALRRWWTYPRPCTKQRRVVAFMEIDWIWLDQDLIKTLINAEMLMYHYTR